MVQLDQLDLFHQVVLVFLVHYVDPVHQLVLRDPVVQVGLHYLVVLECHLHQPCHHFLKMLDIPLVAPEVPQVPVVLVVLVVPV